MAKDPAFLFYPGDYLRDTHLLSDRAQVAYDKIMCELMRNTLITQQKLNVITKDFNDDESSEIMMVLVKVSKGYKIRWVAESIKNRKAFTASRRNNLTGKSKKTNIKKSNSYGSHMENENIIESVNESDNENEKNNLSSLKTKIPFPDFWDLYDKKRGDKRRIREKWDSLTEIEQKKIINLLPDYIASTPDKLYRKDPEKYLNSRGWEDEIIKCNRKIKTNRRESSFD